MERILKENYRKNKVNMTLTNVELDVFEALIKKSITMDIPDFTDDLITHILQRINDARSE